MDEKKYPEPVEALLVVVCILAFILLAAFMVALWMLLPGFEGSLNTKLLTVLGDIPFLLIPLIYVKIRKYDAGSLFRFRPVPAGVIVLSILIGVSLGVLGDELDRLIQIILPVPQWFIDQLQFMRAETVSDWTLLVTGVVILAAFAEELLFRGFVQVSLEKKGDPTRAVLLTSLTWTMIHLNPFWAVQIFIIGVVIGFLAWRTNSVLPGIIVHGINNLLSLILYNSDNRLEWYLMGQHVSVILLIPAAFILVWSIQQLTSIYRPS
jgi:uncharacterized protein